MSKLKILWGLAMVKAPEAMTALFQTGQRRVVDGRMIDPKAQAVGRLLNLVRDTGDLPTLEESRKGLKVLAERFDEPCPPMVRKSDIQLPGADGPRPARLYDAVMAGDDTPRPTLLYLHGGGWIQGDLDTHDGLCGKMAAWAGIRVISYDYRLAPENKFPAGLDDIVACYRALLDTPGDWGVDVTRLAVGGDSAGANLTAALLHDLQGAGLMMPAAQVLIYPAVDTRLNSGSMQAMPDAYVLPVKRIHWYLEQYLPEGQDWNDPRVAPILSDRLAGQPDALILVGGHDPLWDEGLSYAELLNQAGGVTEVIKFPGQVHAFVSITDVIPQGNQALHQIADWLKQKIG